MSQEFLLGTDSFGMMLRKEPENDFQNAEGEGPKKEFKQIEIIDEYDNCDQNNEEIASAGKNQRAESMSDKLNSSQVQNYESQVQQRQRNKALHESFGVDIGGQNRDDKSAQNMSKPTNFGNDSLLEQKFQADSDLNNNRTCISTKNQLQSQIQKTNMHQSGDNNTQEKNSFSDLSMAATNPNNNGLTAVGQGLQQDNLVGSFGSFPAQQNNAEQNQVNSHNSGRKNSKDVKKTKEQPQDNEKTAEKPKNKHHAKARNKSNNKQQNKTKSIGHYRIGKTIGEGTFGKVKLGVHNITGEKVAVKILEKHKILEDVDVQRVSREIKILKLARHPNIIQLYEIIETPKQLYLITEYVSKGELFDYIVKNQRLEESEACEFFQQIISGIQYLKELGIVHRDMKPENLLLDQNGQIKLVDFGLSNTYEQGQTLQTACGSPCYAAPEMIAGKKYHGAQVDVWSCGVILFAMVCGYLPFEDQDTNELYKKILDGSFEIPSWVSESCQDLMKKILENDPKKRYSTDDIMRHEWYTTNHTPVIKNTGLIIGKNKIPLEPSIVKMLKQYGFNQADAEKSLNQNKHNQVTTVYYLLYKRFVMDDKLPSHFGINRLNSPNMDQKDSRNQEDSGYSPVKKNVPKPLNVPADKQESQRSLQRSQKSMKLKDESYNVSKKSLMRSQKSKKLQDQSQKSLMRSHRSKNLLDVSQKSLAKSPRSKYLNNALNQSGSQKGTRIDSQKEIQLSVSPVKKGRRQIDDTLAQQPVFELKANALNLDDEIYSPQNNLAINDYKSFDIDKEERDRRTEEKGSRSPEKKKRRVFAQALSSDDEAAANPPIQVGDGLKIQLQNLSGGSNEQISPNVSNMEMTRNTIKQNTTNVNDRTDSSVSYEGDGEKIILVDNQQQPSKYDQNPRRAKDSRVTSPVDVRSPNNHLDRSQQQAQRINLQFNKTSKQNTDDQPLSTGVREYQQKIKAYTKDNYKYRQKEEGRSIDEKLKTKALLRNIEKILNKGVLQGFNNSKQSNKESSDRQPNRQLPPQVPKTTTAAAYESSSMNKVINVKRQNRRASSIDECVVQLQIQNQNHYQTRQAERPKQSHNQTYNKDEMVGQFEQSQMDQQQQMYSTQNTNYGFNQLQLNSGVKPYVVNDNQSKIEQDPCNQPINFYGNPNQQQFYNQVNSLNASYQRPPLHNQGLQSEKKFQRFSQENQFRGFAGNFTDEQQHRQMVNKHVFSESPNRDRFNPQIGNFMLPQQLTTNSFKENNYQFPQGNPALYQAMNANLPPRGVNVNYHPGQTPQPGHHQQFDTSPKMNYVERLNSSQEGASNTSISDQAQFRTAPQRARNTFKRQYHDGAGSRQHNPGTNTAQGYRTRIMHNRIKNSQKEDHTNDPNTQKADQTFTEQTPYKQRPNLRRQSNHRNTGQNDNKHANTVKPYMQRRITLSEQQQQQQPLNDDYQTGQFQGMRQDPINFTNQYNIYCHLNDFQKYQWRGYNPVMGGPLSSPPISTLAVGPNPNIGSNLSSPGPQPFMQTGEINSAMLSQYLNFLNQPENLMEFQYQNNLLQLQSQISMIQQQQLSQQLAAIGFMPNLSQQSNPILASSNPSLMQISPAAAQMRNLNSQMQAQNLFGGMQGHHPLQGQQFQTQDPSNFPHFQNQISQSLSPPKKYRQGIPQNSGMAQTTSTGMRNPSPYENSMNQSHIAQANTSYDNGADSGLNQSSGTNFTRNIGSRRSNTNTIRPEDSIDSKQGTAQAEYQLPDQQAMINLQQAKIGNGGKLLQPVVNSSCNNINDNNDETSAASGNQQLEQQSPKEQES